MRLISNQNGFTYILALSIVIIMGIMLGMIGQSWKTIAQRELEDELIFRGDQVAELVYQGLLCKNANPTGQLNVENQFIVENQLNQVGQLSVESQKLWLVSAAKGSVLDDLVTGKEETCANNTKKKFRLRVTASIDPLTNKPWQIIKPVGDTLHFSGVASDSKKEPFRKSFEGVYDSIALDNRQTYSEWLFTWELKRPMPQNQVQNQRLKQNITK